MIKRLYILIYLIANVACCSAQQYEVSDSTRAAHILRDWSVVADEKSTVNYNGLKLNLNKREAKKIACIAIKKVYGVSELIRQFPLFIYELNGLWVFEGSKSSKKRNSVVVIVVNSDNGAVEFLIHTK